MSISVRLVAVGIVLSTLGLSASGCGPRCSSESVCAVVGTGSDIEVCNGDDFVGCNDSNRGATISCVNQPRIATCSPDGWTFQNAPK